MKLIRLLPFAVAVLLWWLLTSGTHLVAPIQLPSPGSVWSFAVTSAGQGILGSAILGSLQRFAIGFALGVILGAPLAVAVASSTAFSEMVLPAAKFFQAISGVTWIPLALVWFGISSAASIFIILNTTFFIIFYATLTGVRSINPRLRHSIRALGGGFIAEFRHVLLPGALPHVFTGVRVAVGYGWRALIASEIITSGAGLGVLIWNGQRQLNTQEVFVGLILIGTISFVLDRFILQFLEDITVVRWGLRA
jgi:taurine transport system permease protein